MISKNSFWASCLENHKRRIWVWIVAFMTQLLVYVGVLTVYLSRIRYYNTQGMYKTLEQFQEALVQAAQDALGFQPMMMFDLIVLGVIIGNQGFSYLNDRRKVDMYHSVPVSKTRRFFAIYLNGIVIYLTATLMGLLAGIIVAAAQGVMTGSVLAVIGIAFVWNLLFYLIMYHTMILAVMLTGNVLVSLCAFGVLTVYEPLLYECISSLRFNFYERYSNYLVPFEAKCSAVFDYYSQVYDLKWLDTAREIAGVAAPYLGKWLVMALILFIAAYVCYQKRMSEAAGKAIAFAKLKPVLKVFVVIEASMMVGCIVLNFAYENDVLMLAGMLLSSIICCAVMEVVYEFDLKGMLRHWGSGGVAILSVLAVFCIYKFDLLGYDRYVPDADQVDSVVFWPETENMDYWDDNFEHIPNNEYLLEHMHVTAIEDVIALARKDQQESSENMRNRCGIEVVYRLKSGRNVGRRIWVDYDNPASEELLNHIVGSQEYKEGMYQIVDDKASYDKVESITYYNGSAEIILPLEDAQKLREAYLKDLEQMDFSMVRNQFPCGELCFDFQKYMLTRYPVYDSYSNVLAYLKEQNAYYPVQLNAEDVASITIMNYHNEVYDDDHMDMEGAYYRYRAVAVGNAEAESEEVTVTETFYEKEQIEEILKHIYPSYLRYYGWHSDKEFDSNYDVCIEFNKDSDYPYIRTQYYFNYFMLAGQVPDFVVEATALE